MDDMTDKTLEVEGRPEERLKATYTSAMGKLSFSDGAKARMVDKLKKEADGMTGTGKNKAQILHFGRKWPAWRIAAAVAAVVLAAALGAGGIAYASGVRIGVLGLVDDVFNGAPANTEVVSKIGRPIGASAHANGVTITADAVIGDAQNYAIVYSISRDDGRPITEVKADEHGNLPLMFNNQTTWIAGVWGANGSNHFYDSDPSDNSIQYVEEMSLSTHGTSIVGQTAYANFSDLCVFDSESAQVEPIVSGHWNLKFQMNYEDASVEIPSGQVFSINGLEATMDKLSVSPIALSLSYTVHEAANLPDAPSGKMPPELEARMSQLLNLGMVTITLRDGSTITFRDLGGGSTGPDDQNSTRVEKSSFLPRIIDASEVSSVTIGDTTFSVQ